MAKIGKISIKYFHEKYAEKGQFRGNVKSIGSHSIKYEGWSSYGEKVGMVGAPIKIGSTTIKYYETHYDKGFEGKIKSIGKVRLEYHKDNSQNRKAGIVGAFKKKSGRFETCYY